MDSLTQTTIRFCNRLEKAEIKYVVGGSVASGMWGEPRHTNDVDVEVWVQPDSAEVFLSAFDDNYIVSRSELMDAIKLGTPFRSVQVLDITDILKFDCFLRDFGALDEEMFQASIWLPFGDSQIRVACAEHILVQKMRWYELGNRVSERQWRDMIGIVSVLPNIRWDLVERWAEAYGVTHLIPSLKQA